MKKVYATIWHHSAGKWKLEEAIVVENEKTVGWAVGGSFFFGTRRVKEATLKEALMDLLFRDYEKDEKDWEKEFEILREEVEINFVSDKEMKKLRKKFPEEKGDLNEELKDVSWAF